MESGPDESTPLQRSARVLSEGVPAPLRRRDPVVLGVVAITLFALILRLLWLGARAAHWDEARVAYWILRYEETGAIGYNPWIHGPFIHHVTRPLFVIFGPSDFLGRLPVAIVGGLFPLSALLFREHLRDHETVIVAFLLGANSILLYYSRFLRSDILVAAFMITALGFLVRTYDTRDARYLYPAALFLGFGIAAKENALVYILTWLGATGLLVGAALLRPRQSTSRRALVRRLISSAVGRLRERDRGLKLFVGHTVGAVVLLFGVWLFMFAPRGDVLTHYPYPITEESIGTLSLGDALERPWKFPELVWNTGNHWLENYPMWSDKALSGEEQASGTQALIDRWEKYRQDYFDVLKNYALPTMLFGAFGTVRAMFGGLCAVFAPLRKRFAVEPPRNLVLFGGYAGFASVLGYPAGMDIFGAWNASHPVVILVFPAAAGLGVFYRWGRAAATSLDTSQSSDTQYVLDALQSVLAALIVLVVVGHVVATGVGAAFVNDTDWDQNDLIQYGQPADDFREEVQRLDRTAADNDGVDVLVYGSYFNGDSSAVHFPSCMNWFDGLPMSWYLRAADANVSCMKTEQRLERIEDDVPPVVLTREDEISDLQPYVSGYDYSIFRIRTYNSQTVLLFNESAIDR